MKLQYAMDRFSIDEALRALEPLHDVIDILEVGTPMLLRFGLEAVRRIRRAYPRLQILADAKIMDGGQFEADQCFESGADLTTVMALANAGTIDGVLKSAKSAGGKVLCDMMNVTDLAPCAARMVDLGVDYICVHNASDVLDMDRAVSEAEAVSQAIDPDHLAIAGGVNPLTITRLKKFSPAVIVVGSAIVKAPDPREMVLTLRQMYENC